MDNLFSPTLLWWSLLCYLHAVRWWRHCWTAVAMITWSSAFSPLWFIYIAESQNALAAELHVQLPFRCWTNRSWEHISLGVLSGLQHRLSGTCCHKQFSSVILWLFLNPDLKLFCSIRLLLNTDPTCRQRLWSYDRMKKKTNYIYHKLIRQIIRHIAKISMEGCRKARAIGAGHP